MSPRDLSNAMANDDRLFNGRFFSSNPIDIGSGDCVGVVLLVPGAPESQEDVYPYLYRRLCSREVENRAFGLGYPT